MALPAPKGSLRGGNLFETILSGLVILVAVAFATYFFVRTGTGHLRSYPLQVSLRDAAGLDLGSDVRVAGAKVGSVTALGLDARTYRAIVTIEIRDDLFLPVDSAALVSSSALGEVYLTLRPGKASQSAPPGGMLNTPIHAVTGRPTS